MKKRRPFNVTKLIFASSIIFFALYKGRIELYHGMVG